MPPVTRFPDPEHAPIIEDLIRRGALFAVSHSGGKDSQAATILVSRLVPARQLLIVHAPLGDVEWPGTIEHIQATIPRDVPLIHARVASGKSFLEQVADRGKWPDPARRWCTANMKRGPIERELRRHLTRHPEHRGLIVSIMGLRADESRSRAARLPFARSDRNSRAGREWYNWLPIHALTTRDVFDVIASAGQRPHWAYAAGSSRVSCSFCIMASRSDLCTAARLRPDLYRTYAALEQELGHTLSPSGTPLPAITRIPVPGI